MKLLLSILAVSLYVSGYWICSYFYPDVCKTPQAAQGWWDLRMNLLSVLIMICFLFSMVNTKKWELKHIKFVLGVGVGLSTADVIDRLFFDITVFTSSDVVLIILTLAISYTETYTKLTQRLQKLCQRKLTN